MIPGEIKCLTQDGTRYTLHCSSPDDLSFIADWFDTAICDWTFLSERLVAKSRLTIERTDSTDEKIPYEIAFCDEGAMLKLEAFDNSRRSIATALINPGRGSLESVNAGNEEYIDFIAEWIEGFIPSLAGICAMMELYPGYINPDYENKRLVIDLNTENLLDPLVKETTPRIVPAGSDKVYTRLVDWMTKYYGDMANILNSVSLPFKDVIVCNSMNQPMYYACPDEKNQSILFSIYMQNTETDTTRPVFTMRYNTVINRITGEYESRSIRQRNDREMLRPTLPLSGNEINGEMFDYILSTYGAICTWVSDVTVETRRKTASKTEADKLLPEPKDKGKPAKPDSKDKQARPLPLTGRIVRITAKAINENDKRRIAAAQRARPDHVVHVRGFVRHYASGMVGPVKAHVRYADQPEKNVPTYTIRLKDITRKNRKRKRTGTS